MSRRRLTAPTPIRETRQRTIHDYALDVAAAKAGATRAELRARQAEIVAQLDTFETAYDAALTFAASQPWAFLGESTLTISEAAELLNVSRSTVQELVSAGKLQKVDGLGRSVSIPVSELRAFIAKRAA